MCPPLLSLLKWWCMLTDSVYIGIMLHLLTSKHSPVFLIAAIMELPTLDLALSNLFPVVRNDLRFLSSFFLIRIAFNAYLLFDCVRPSARQMMDDSWIPTGVISAAMALHTMWFHGGVTGYLKRASQAKTDSRAKVTSTPAPATPETPTKTMPAVSTGALGVILEAEEDLIAGDEPDLEDVSEASTPDDSPLVTPRTPSFGPASYVPSLPSMPNLGNFKSIPQLASLPTIPQLSHRLPSQIPTVSIPSFADLTAALNAHADPTAQSFKEAVKTRWADRRERFAQVANGVDFGAR